MKRGKHLYNQVILADDDPDHATLFRIILKQVDPAKNLTVARDGKELLELLNRQAPDLIFLDLHMPCKNGFDCLDEIRKQPALQKVPVVVYSSSTYMGDISKSYEHKADLYMVKPFNSVHLRNALQSILRLEWWKETESEEKFYFINNKFVPFTAA